MAQSKSQKLRKKQGKAKGYDLHSLKRGGQGIIINMTTKKTKTKREKLERMYQKEKQGDLCNGFG